MRHAIRLGFLTFLALAAGLALADTDRPGLTLRWSEAQVLTRAAPTVVTEGMPLGDVTGLRVMVSAASGQTLSGAGSLQAYGWDNDLARWLRVPDLDLTIPATCASKRDCRWADLDVPVQSGRLLYAATGVTVSSGTVTVSIKARTKAQSP